MSSSTINKDRLITGGIIILAVIGITYFGFNAFSGDSGSEKPNPFEYNIDYFKIIYYIESPSGRKMIYMFLLINPTWNWIRAGIF
jgi:ABC-type uncharacterized transport system permease subunit